MSFASLQRDIRVPVGARRAIRRAVSVACELVTSNHDTPLRFVATDLSPVGMWLQTIEPVRAGETVVACFEPGDGWAHGELMVFAEVARVVTSRSTLSEPGLGMGLEFIDLAPSEHEQLTKWLSERRSPLPRRRRPLPRRALRNQMPRQIPLVGRSYPAVEMASLEGLPRCFRPLSGCWR